MLFADMNYQNIGRVYPCFNVQNVRMRNCSSQTIRYSSYNKYFDYHSIMTLECPWICLGSNSIVFCLLFLKFQLFTDQTFSFSPRGQTSPISDILRYLSGDDSKANSLNYVWALNIDLNYNHSLSCELVSNLIIFLLQHCLSNLVEYKWRSDWLQIQITNYIISKW